MHLKDKTESEVNKAFLSNETVRIGLELSDSAVKNPIISNKKMAYKRSGVESKSPENHL